MHSARTTSGLDKPGIFAELQQQLAGLLDGERDGLANCANTAALIYHGLPELNWAGFYFLRHEELVLGPFQGKVACVRIPLGKGVCGTAAARRETLIVPDVHAFPGHIACDADSRSEIVVPLIQIRRAAGRARSRQPASRPIRSRTMREVSRGWWRSCSQASDFERLATSRS